MRILLMTLIIALPAAAAEKNELPAAWHGTWTGTLEMPRQDPVRMAIVIAPIKDSPRYTWQITYGEGAKASVRKYELVPDAATPGKFQIDENNAILLDMTLLKDVFHSQFEVGGQLLAARYELRDGKLHYEITTSGKGIETGRKETAIVKVFPVTSGQTAILSKSK